MKRCFNMVEQIAAKERVLYLVSIYFNSGMSESFEESLDEAISAANKGSEYLGSIAKVYRQPFIGNSPVGKARLVYHSTITRTVQYDERIDSGVEDAILDA